MIKQIFFLFKILPDYLIKRFYIIQTLIFISSFLQLLSVLSIGPFVSILSGNYEFILKYEIFNYFNQFDKIKLLIIISSVVFVLFLISNIFTAIIYNLQQKFSQRSSAHFSHQILEKFYNRSYLQNVEHNSAYYKSLITEVGALTGNIIMPLSDLNSKVFPVSLILLTIFFINPIATSIVFSFLAFGYLLIYLIVKNKLSHFSKLSHKYNIEGTKLINEILHSYKEAKIFNFENYFLSKFKNLKINASEISANNIVIQVVPRQFFEVLALGSIIITIFYLLSNQTTVEAISTLAIYIAAGYRLMPNLQSILFSISSVKGNEQTLSVIYSLLLKRKSYYEKNEFSIKNIKSLKIKKLNFSYKNQKIFNNTNVEFSKGKITGIFGISGSGKSTLSNIIMNFLPLEKSSTFLVNNKKLNANFAFLQNFISFVPQNIFVLNDTIIKNITFKNELTKIEYLKIYNLLKILQLNKFIKNNKISLQKISEDGKNISGGQAQRIGLARCLFKESEIIILDEFTSGLDQTTEKKILKQVRKIFKDKIVIVISHKSSLKNFCDIIYELDNKKLIKV
jgi:HlyD family secretion protein